MTRRGPTCLAHEGWREISADRARRPPFGAPNRHGDLLGDEIAVQIQVEAAQGKDFDAKHATTALGVKH